MSQHQTPRNGLAKVLWDADPDQSPEEIAVEKDRYECPYCGWQSQLEHDECMVCDHSEPLDPIDPTERRLQ